MTTPNRTPQSPQPLVVRHSRQSAEATRLGSRTPDGQNDSVATRLFAEPSPQSFASSPMASAAAPTASPSVVQAPSDNKLAAQSAQFVLRKAAESTAAAKPRCEISELACAAPAGTFPPSCRQARPSCRLRCNLYAPPRLPRRSREVKSRFMEGVASTAPTRASRAKPAQPQPPPRSGPAEPVAGPRPASAALAAAGSRAAAPPSAAQPLRARPASAAPAAVSAVALGAASRQSPLHLARAAVAARAGEVADRAAPAPPASRAPARPASSSSSARPTSAAAPSRPTATAAAGARRAAAAAPPAQPAPARAHGPPEPSAASDGEFSAVEAAAGQPPPQSPGPRGAQTPSTSAAPSPVKTAEGPAVAPGRAPAQSAAASARGGTKAAPPAAAAQRAANAGPTPSGRAAAGTPSLATPANTAQTEQAQPLGGSLPLDTQLLLIQSRRMQCQLLAARQRAAFASQARRAMNLSPHERCSDALTVPLPAPRDFAPRLGVRRRRRRTSRS